MYSEFVEGGPTVSLKGVTDGLGLKGLVGVIGEGKNVVVHIGGSQENSL